MPNPFHTLLNPFM